MVHCTIVLLRSLPVYPNTVHGQCTSVVLDTTSNRVYCILLLMDARYSVVQKIRSRMRRILEVESTWADVVKRTPAATSTRYNSTTGRNQSNKNSVNVVSRSFSRNNPVNGTRV